MPGKSICWSASSDLKSFVVVILGLEFPLVVDDVIFSVLSPHLADEPRLEVVSVAGQLQLAPVHRGPLVTPTRPR